MTRDWHDWHRAYDDPGSSLSRRLAEVRLQVESLLVASEPRQVVSLCAGDGRDLLPGLAAHAPRARALLVELDPELAATATAYAAEARLPAVEVRTADAGLTDSLAGHVPADLLVACGVFGNVDEAGVARTVAALPSLLAPGGHVVWTRGVGAPADALDPVGDLDIAPTADPDHPGPDPADRIRGMLEAAGFAEVAFVRPADAAYRVGVHRLELPPTTFTPGVRLFEFVG